MCEKKKRRYNKLTPEKAKIIAKTYLETGNASEAFRRAGFAESTARNKGLKILQKNAEIWL